MKKSERNKIKIGVIRKLKLNLGFNKRLLKRDWHNRYSSKLYKTTYRVAIKTDFETIHRILFVLRAAEKQIPMPLKVQSIPQGKYNFHQREVLYFVMKHFYCQNCGHEMLKDYYEDLASVKFCPYCGQKLWWPKN